MSDIKRITRKVTKEYSDGMKVTTGTVTIGEKVEELPEVVSIDELKGKEKDAALVSRRVVKEIEYVDGTFGKTDKVDKVVGDEYVCVVSTNEYSRLKTTRETVAPKEHKK